MTIPTLSCLSRNAISFSSDLMADQVDKNLSCDNVLRNEVVGKTVPYVSESSKYGNCDGRHKPTRKISTLVSKLISKSTFGKSSPKADVLPKQVKRKQSADKGHPPKKKKLFEISLKTTHKNDLIQSSKSHIKPNLNQATTEEVHVKNELIRFADNLSSPLGNTTKEKSTSAFGKTDVETKVKPKKKKEDEILPVDRRKTVCQKGKFHAINTSYCFIWFWVVSQVKITSV